jgi:hypothetical protein
MKKEKYLNRRKNALENRMFGLKKYFIGRILFYM